MFEETGLIDNILALARFIGVELGNSDIDHTAISKVAPVFVKFVSQWMRDEFYSCYLHCVKAKVLTVSTLFRHCKDDNRRIYVSEHHTLHLQRSEEAEENEPVFESFTRKGVVSVILLSGDARIPNDTGELITHNCC
jgi:hypothetical protein